jgi:hypothetical protein
MSSEVEDIARFAGSGDAERLMAQVDQHALPPALEELVQEYVEFPWTRDRFIWKWCHELAPQNTLPFIGPEYADQVPTDKTITILFITLLDDVLERERDRITFAEAAKIPFDTQPIDWSRNGLDVEYLEFTQRVWNTLLERLSRAPEYETYLPLLRYDVKQAINAIEYSSLVIDHPVLATLHDLELYESHNMVMYAYADIDLMHGPPEVGKEMPTLRRAIWCAQQMARIGNWLSTWERELREGDFSSAVLVYAFRNGLISEEELADLRHHPTAKTVDEIAERIRRNEVENVFLRRWDRWQDELIEIDHQLETVELRPFIDGLKEVLRYHLASKGLK